MIMDCKAFTRPLGMARILEVLLSIVSFACTVNFNGQSTFSVTCTPTSAHPLGTSLPIHWEYPFRLSTIQVDKLLCNSTIPSPLTMEPLFFVDFAIQAQFFVFVGVVSFLVSMAWVVIYMWFWRAYAIDTLLPTMDLVICIVSSVLWLCADCSWASAYGSMQMYLSHAQILQSLNSFDFCQNGGTCAMESEKSEFGTGGFGLTLGFINSIMWLLNAFLAYREQQKIKYERDRLMYTADAFRAQSTPAETMDASSINAGGGFRAI